MKRFIELAEARCSVRGYRSDPLPEELLNQVLEAGRLAPSACNLQPWHVMVVREQEQRDALSEAYSRDWVWQAPVLLVVCVDTQTAWKRGDGKSYADVDGSILMDHMTLCATDLGLGTCWIGAFDAPLLRERLGLPEGIEPLAMTPLGYPDAEPRPKKRKALDEFVHQERW